MGHYAKSKYLGELFVQENARKYLICRAGWMMGGGPKKDKKFIQKLMCQLANGQDESFIDCLSKSNMVISGMSGAVIESIVFGIPVVLLRNRRGITFNPIPKEIPQGIWIMCESSDEIIDLIQKYSSIADEQLQGY